MFRLPSLPSVPGLSSDPPKLAFRNASNGLARLSRNVCQPFCFVYTVPHSMHTLDYPAQRNKLLEAVLGIVRLCRGCEYTHYAAT